MSADRKGGWDIDKALEAAGSWDRFQKCILAMCIACAIPNAFVALHFVFSQYEPRHHCTYPEEFLSYANQSDGNSDVISTMIPLELNQENKWVFSQCKMYDRNYSQYRVAEWPEMFVNDSNTIDCPNRHSYEFTTAEETAAMEFSMVCEADWKGPFAVSMFGAGKAAGCIFGLGADWYGRRPLFITTVSLQALSEVLKALSWSFPVYCSAIALSSACSIMNYIILFVAATEMTNCKWRNFLTIWSSFGYAAGYGCVALLAYLFRRWRVFIGVIALCSAVIYIPCCWFFPESPRWLAQRGRSKDAIRWLRVIAKVNGKKEEFEEALKTQKNKCVIAKNNRNVSGVGETIRVFFRSGIASRLYTTAVGWLLCSLVYVALTIYSTDFSENRFINLFLNGLVEIPACVIGFVLLKYLGRPRTIFLLMSICGISNTILPFLSEDLQFLSTILVVCAKGAISAVYFAWYLVATEVFPTLQRSSALTICSTVSRIGTFSSPYLVYVRKYNHWVPNVVVGVLLSSFGLLTMFFIPETLGVNLPDTATEARGNKRFYRLNIMRKFTKKNVDTVSVIDEDETHAKV